LSDNRDDFEITKENILNSSGVIDVFSNRFDLTFFNEFGPDKEWPRKFTQLPFNTEQGEDDGLVSYEYNSDFFRCDNFTTVHKEKYHVVFGGCSETEGVGGNLNELWAYNLYLELKQKYDIGGYYSLARSGNGWHKIALSLMTYVEKYGKPTHFFVMLPNIGRNFYWDKENKRWKYSQKYVHRGSRHPHAEEDLFDLDEHKRQYMEFAVGWKMLIAYCKSNNIKILYSTWWYDENNNLARFDHQSKVFMPLGKKDAFQFIFNLYPEMDVPKKLLEKRDGHSGSIIHEYWKTAFLKEIEQRGMFND
jgi:hypothetical protein